MMFGWGTGFIGCSCHLGGGSSVGQRLRLYSQQPGAAGLKEEKTYSHATGTKRTQRQQAQQAQEEAGTSQVDVNHAIVKSQRAGTREPMGHLVRVGAGLQQSKATKAGAHR